VAVVMVLPDTEVGTGPAADRTVAAIRAVLPAGAMQRPTPSPLGVSTSDTYPAAAVAPGSPASPEVVADTHWTVYTNRDQTEVVLGDIEPVKSAIASLAS
jgi:hypothetical protein